MSEFLVIGLGSMGKRRIRCLKSLGYTSIWGFDARQDRVNEAIKLYGIKPLQELEDFIKEKKPIVIISVPPHLHGQYMQMAVRNKSHFFVEASVIEENFKEIITIAAANNTQAIPSCTLMFHPAIKKINELVQEGVLGKLSNWIYHSGQYLPDWHPYEKVSDYYVSRKDTSGGREIVPFELTWLCKVFGLPKSVHSVFGKTINFEGGENVDDTYNLILKHEGFFGSLVVDVVSRFSTRKLLINGQDAQLRWDWQNDYIEIYYAKSESWEKIFFEKGKSHEGYNPNIIEDMYVDEVRTFLESCEKGEGHYPTNLSYDFSILNILYEAEKNAL